MANPGNANVQSLDALRDFRLALVAFHERAQTAMAELRAKIDRTKGWIDQDRPLYWREQQRRAYDEVTKTRIAYDLCRLRTVGGRHSECIEEGVAKQRAKARLEYCQQKIDAVRRWSVKVGQEVDDYRGRTGPMQRQLEEDVPNMLAKLSRMIDAIEGYADVGISTANSMDSRPIRVPETETETQAVAERVTQIHLTAATNSNPELEQKMAESEITKKKVENDNIR